MEKPPIRQYVLGERKAIRESDLPTLAEFLGLTDSGTGGSPVVLRTPSTSRRRMGEPPMPQEPTNHA